jgi:hypothetical protein
MRRNFYSRRLKGKEPIAKIARDAKRCQSGAGFLREVIRHLDIDVEGRRPILPCPTLFDDFNQFLRDVDAPTIIPPVFKPPLQLSGRIMIQYVNIQLAAL